MGCKSKECICTYVDANGNKCPNHGKCCECIKHHRDNDELPACYFTKEQEQTYDRSISYFNSQNI